VYRRIAMIARWKPVHLGQAPVLRALCEVAEHAIIGIGSSNRYNLRNPFTYEETEHMIRLVIGERDHVEIVPVPDLDDGPRWRLMVLERLLPLDCYVTDNPYVASLLADDVSILRPVELVAAADRVPIDGTMVRQAIARGDGWIGMVPPEVADYITSNRLDERFRSEFGLETLALAEP
jgi:nicotinamide-nucleotide adenylyltransferase